MKSIRNLLITGLCVYAAVFCMHSCKGSGSSAGEQDGNLTMEEVDSLMVPLDSTTTQVTTYLQLVGDSVLAIYNRPNHDIVLYNLYTGTTDKVNINNSGPNAVNGVDGFCYVSPDSIWLYSSWGNVLTMIDADGNKKATHILSSVKDRDDNPLKYSAWPFPLAITPYIVKNGIHYLQGMDGQSAEGQEPGVTMIFNENTGNWKTANPYPALYGPDEDIVYWNTFGYRQAGYAMSPDGKMVISFPASDSLYVYDPITDNRVAYLAAYSKPTNIHQVKTKTQVESTINYLEQYSYPAVLYDKYNKLYYRIVNLPFKNFDRENPDSESNKRPGAVIILNERFEKVGEYLIPDGKRSTINAFVSEQGLHINAPSDDDDFMKFRVFKLKK